MKSFLLCLLRVLQWFCWISGSVILLWLVPATCHWIWIGYENWWLGVAMVVLGGGGGVASGFFFRQIANAWRAESATQVSA